jgi:hypothetical protein
MRCGILLAILCIILAAPPYPRCCAQESGYDFFEKKIRPILVQHCYPCHSKQSNKQRGGLLLDSRAGLLEGGDNGPAIVPGKPADSLLLKAIKHTSPKLKMPRDGKLAPEAIADLEHWITIGAPDPRTQKVVVKGIDFEAAKKHWSYQPIRQPGVPAVKNKTWVPTPIDAFILAKLEEKNLGPSAPADSRTLLRRLYFDLIGLPPTPDEVEEFVAAWETAGAKAASGGDPSLARRAGVREQERVWERVVDRLLRSPNYGERWGRHWLDVARYADTKDGVLMFGDDRVRPYAYTYRDYVIRAFNEDTPFNRFVEEQLAADQIEPKVEPWRLGAMGFLTLGRQYDNNIHDVIDDRIDTVSRGFLGLTVSCARCHDHKYDAIPTADYYSLYGVFANCETPLELPLADRAEDCKTLSEYEKQAGPHRQKLQQMVDSQYALLTETARQRVGDYLVRVATSEPDLAETAIYFLSLAPTDLRPPLVHRWRRFLEQPSCSDDPVFGPWPELMKLGDATYAVDAAAVIDRWKKKPAFNPLVLDALQASKPANKTAVARAYGQLLRSVHEQTKGKPASAPQQQLLEKLTSKQSPCYFPKAHTWLYMSRGEKDAYGSMRIQFDKIALKLANAPPRAMVLQDAADLVEPRIFLRGNPAVAGATVPRQFLRILAGEKRQPFTQGSGRLELARAIASPDNPLTSRVLVNRVWMHHFGEPLVSSPSDFGTRSTPPSHPELLDWLAWTFMQEGWSLKKLHRHIVMSAAYRQASFDRSEARKIDPENRLYWRAHRRRLDLEAMRDTLLVVAGRLDRTMGGRHVDIVNDPKNARRTVYGLVDRQSLPGLFRAFDFAVPDQSVERRPMTTVPQQALFGLNSPFLAEQAKALAARTAKLGGEPRVRELYRLVYARNPEPAEIQAGLRFVEGAMPPPGRVNGEPEKAGVSMPPQQRSQLTPWQQYAQVLLLTNELMFVD